MTASERVAGRSPRERRLVHEFERMRSLRREGGLIEFFCADLTAEEASAFLSNSRSLGRLVVENLPGFLEPDQFAARYPNRAPEKYLISFKCRGLMKVPGGDIRP